MIPAAFLTTLLLAIPSGFQSVEGPGPSLDDYSSAFLRGWEALESGELDAAAAAFERAEALRPGGPVCPYYRACVAARAGELDEALRWLEEACERGYREPLLAGADGDLAALRDREGFRDLLVRMSVDDGAEQGPAEPLRPLLARNDARGTFSPDGELLLTVGHYAWTVWDVRSGAALSAGGPPTRGVRFAPDSRTIRMEGEPGLHLEVEARTGVVLHAEEPPEWWPERARVGGRSTVAVVRSTNLIELEDAHTGELRHRLGGWFSGGVVLDSEGTRLMTAGRRALVSRGRHRVETVLAIWDAESGERLTERVLDGERSLRLGLAGGEAVLYAVDVTAGALHVFDAASGAGRTTARMGVPPNCLRLPRPEERELLVGGRDGSVSAWDVPEGRRTRWFPAHEREVDLLELDRERRHLLTRSLGCLKLWALGAERAELLWEDASTRPSAEGERWTAKLSPRGDLVRVGGSLRNAVDGVEQVALAPCAVPIQALVPDADVRRIAFSCRDGSLRSVDGASGSSTAWRGDWTEGARLLGWVGAGLLVLDEESRTLECRGAPTADVRWSRSFEGGARTSSRWSLSPEAATVLVWSEGDGLVALEADTGERRWAVAAIQGFPAAVAWSDDAARIAVSSRSGRVVQLDAGVGEPVGRSFVAPKQATALQYSHDGRLLAVGDERGGVRVISADDPARPTMQTQRGQSDCFRIVQLAFDSAGELLFSCDSSGTGSCWSLASGEKLWWEWEFEGSAVRFSGAPGAAARELLQLGPYEVVAFDATKGGWSRTLTEQPSKGLICLRTNRYAGGESLACPVDPERLESRWSWFALSGDGGVAFATSGHYWAEGPLPDTVFVPAGDRMVPLACYESLLLDPKRLRAHIADGSIRTERLPQPPSLVRVAPLGRAVIGSDAGAQELVVEGRHEDGIAGFELRIDGELLGPQQSEARRVQTGAGDRLRLSFQLERSAGRGATEVEIRAVGARGVTSAPDLLTVAWPRDSSEESE